MAPVDDFRIAKKVIPLLAPPRYGAGDEIASLAAYLSGHEAGYITGASLTIDSGVTA